MLFVVHLKKTREIPENFAFVAGDAIYNLRSCLDHLAFALAESYSGFAAAEKGLGQFPIHGAIGSYMDKGVVACRYMSDEVKGIIETLQPYHAGKKASEHPLAVLNALSNIDKHRHLTLGRSVRMESSVALSPESQDIEIVAQKTSIRAGTFSDETAVAQILCRVTGSKPKPVFDNQFIVDIAFPDSGPAPGKVALMELEGVFVHIKDVVFKALERYVG